MAASGFFTYRDLYGGKPEKYQYEPNIQFSHVKKVKSLSLINRTIISVPTTTITSTSPTIKLTESDSSTRLQSNFDLYKLIQLVPFVYIHWLLIGFAALLTLLLLTIFICYCCRHCRKTKKTENEKKEPSSRFYRYRASNQSDHTYNIYETTTTLPFSSAKRSHRSKSKKHSNDQCLDEDPDNVDSPLIPRINISETTTLSAHSDTASSLLTEMKSRLSTRSSDSSLRPSRTCEIPIKRATMPSDFKTNGTLFIETD